MRVGKMGFIPSSPTRMNMYVYTKNSPANPLSSESKQYAMLILHRLKYLGEYCKLTLLRWQVCPVL